MACALIGFVVLTCGLLMPATVHARPIALAWDASTDDVSGRCEGSRRRRVDLYGQRPAARAEHRCGDRRDLRNALAHERRQLHRDVRPSDGNLERSRTFV